MKKVVFLSLICLLLISGCSVKKTKELSSSERFAAEYSVSEDNPFEYTSIDDILNILDNGTGIIFFGNSDCEWCVQNAGIFTKALKGKNIEKVYYYNPNTIKNNNPKKYNRLVSLLNTEESVLDDETTEQLASENSEDEKALDDSFKIPAIYFVYKGSIISYNDQTLSDIVLEDDSNIKREKKLKKTYVKLIDEFNKKCTENI